MNIDNIHIFWVLINNKYMDITGANNLNRPLTKESMNMANKQRTLWAVSVGKKKKKEDTIIYSIRIKNIPKMLKSQNIKSFVRKILARV